MVYDVKTGVLGKQEFLETIGSSSKFNMLKYQGGAMLLSNPNADYDGNRNTLSLSLLDDKFHIKKEVVLLHNDDAKHYGYQYPNAIIEDKSLLIAVRVAENSNSWHNANKIFLVVLPLSAVGL